jgi:hypothetical protein
MNERAIRGLREKPISRKSLPHHDDILRTNMRTETTPFTGYSIDYSVVDCMKATNLRAKTALGTFLKVDRWRSPAVELLLYQDPWLKQEMEISSIHITVHHDLVLRERSERPCNGCLSCPSLAANDS